MSDYDIKASELNKRITLQKFGKVIVDDFETEGWTDYKTVWAKINNLYGSEFYAAMTANAETTVEFVIRYNVDIEKEAGSMRIKFGKKIVNGVEQDRVFNITFPDNIKYGNKFLKLKAKEETAPSV